MRPRNANEREVVKLSSRLKRVLTDAQARYIREKCASPKIYFRGKNAWCGACGESFKVEDIKRGRCPVCGRKMAEEESRKRTWWDDGYMQVVTTCGGYQVARYYYWKINGRKGMTPHIFAQEVMQKWSRPGQLPVTLGCALTMMPQYRRVPFSLWDASPLQIKTSDWYNEWMKLEMYPHQKILHEYIKYGYTGLKGLTMEELGWAFSHPYLETLYKGDNIGQLRYIVAHRTEFRLRFPSIRVAMRHGLKVDKMVAARFGQYIDYLDMLKKTGRDLHNPKYVAAKDWEKQHDKITAEIQAKHQREREERQRRLQIEREERDLKRLEESQKGEAQFKKRIRKWAGFVITDGDLEIRPLMTIREFFEEGEAMVHCVFSAEYFKKDNCLILSARRNGERVETIEVNTKNFAVVQSRGKHNSQTEDHGRILGLLAANREAMKRYKPHKIATTN